MKIAITGSKGFIGQHFITYLMTKNIDYIELIPDQLENYSDITHIVHLAGKTSVMDSWNNVPIFLEDNLTLTSMVLDYARKNRITVILFSTYGYHPEYPINSPYHLTKAFIEQLGLFYHQQFKLPISILRLGSVYGTGQKNYHLIPTILNQILNSDIQKILVKNLSTKRAYIDVRDVVESIYHYCQSTQAFHLEYVGSSILYTVEDIIKKMLRLAYVSKPYYQETSNSSDSFLASIEKNMLIENHLKWVPKYSIDLGLKYLIECQ